jgi:hypothetical protein
MRKNLWPQATSRAKEIDEHPIWKLAVPVVTVVLAALGVIAAWLGLFSDAPGRSPGDDSAPSTTTGPRSSAEPETSIVGQCFKGGDQNVPCDTAHDVEVYSASPCSTESMVSFLGGAPSIEVLTPSAGPNEIDFGGLTGCAVSAPDGTSRSRSAAGILQSSDGASWRRCMDDRTEQEIACSEPHTAEIVFVGVPAAGESLNCTERAERYLEAQPQRFAFELVVEQTEVDGEPACVVSVLGANVLTASVRSVGTSNLPISAR